MASRRQMYSMSQTKHHKLYASNDPDPVPGAAPEPFAAPHPKVKAVPAAPKKRKPRPGAGVSRPMDGAKCMSRRQKYGMSQAKHHKLYASMAGEGGHTVEFVVNKNQGMKLQKDLREFGKTVRVVSAQPIGSSGGRLHIVVETDDPETARFLKQWAAQYNAVEKPSWAKPEGVRPKAVKRKMAFSFGLSRRQAYAMSLAASPRSRRQAYAMSMIAASSKPRRDANDERLKKEFVRYFHECERAGVDATGFLIAHDIGTAPEHAAHISHSEKQTRLKRLEAMANQMRKRGFDVDDLVRDIG